MKRVPTVGRLKQRAVVCLAVLLLGFRGASAQLGPEPEKLNLFQMIARSDLVALVRIRSGSLKYAIVEVQESLKGTAGLPSLRIAFRDFNFSRRPGEDLIVFPDGQQEILFLVPYGRQVRRKKARLKNKDLFTLFHERDGRMTLPAEGPEIILGAIRRLAEVTARDPVSQIDALKSFLAGDNPFLTEASLQEIERLHAGDPAIFARLLLLLNSRSVVLRADSLRVIAQVFSAGRLEDEVLDEARATLAAVLEKARNDQDESVRVQAVAAVAAWPNRPEVEQELKAIAGTDEAQAVRYEAERALFERR